MESVRLLTFIGVAVGAFLVGSVPFGLFIAKGLGVTNIRAHGSQNIGATNVTRIVGFWPGGMATLLLDLLKGVLAILIPSKAGMEWFGLQALEFSMFELWFFGLAVVWGHCFSPWLKFKGGKGVATGLGVLLVLTPWAALGAIISFILAFTVYRVGALASLVAVCVAMCFHIVIQPFELYWFIGLLIVWTILMRHEENIDRMMLGQDNAV